MKLKKNKQSKIIYNIFAIALVILGIYLFRDTIKNIGLVIGRVFYPIKKSVYNITYTTKSNISSLKNINEIIQDTRKLQSKNYELELKLLEHEELERENQRLKELLNIIKEVEYKFIIANVEYRDSMSIYESLYVDKGRRDGVEPDMIVLKEGALFGRVVEVEEKKSRVDLLTKENYKVSVVSRDRKNLGILKGSNNQLLDLEYIIVDSKIKIGDELITSGISNIYPPNIFVGKVIEIEDENNELYKRIKVQLPYSMIDVTELILVKKDIKMIKKDNVIKE